MSNVKNEILLVRAYELIEEYTGHPSGVDKTMLTCIEMNDLDNLMATVIKLEGEQAQEYFYNFGLLERGDEY